MDRQIEKLTQKAIDEAVSGNFLQAIKYNEEIIELDKGNVEAHLRLGFAFLHDGQFKQAKKAYAKALKLQPANLIAKNNLSKIEILDSKTKSGASHFQKDVSLDPNLFLNIPGKTKAVLLKNIGQANELARLKIGQRVNLQIKKRRVEVRTSNNEYVGALPDDLSKRLIAFLQARSEYSVYIKEATKNSVDVFIREDKLGSSVRRFASFPKNIQENLKVITDEDEEGGDRGVDIERSEEVEDEEELDHDKPIDIEELAEQIDEIEAFPDDAADEDENDDE